MNKSDGSNPKAVELSSSKIEEMRVEVPWAILFCQKRRKNNGNEISSFIPTENASLQSNLLDFDLLIESIKLRSFVFSSFYFS